MPSAANVKIDKQISPENALAESSGSGTSAPLRQAITIIEHKIRNLEKRKAKLDTYKELQNNGKELNADQKTAVAKYDEVIYTLDFARDLCKQFLGIVSSTEKEAKRQAKKEAALKAQAELARLREILLVQDALNQMGNESVRDDFLHGRNNAAQLSEGDLKLLDDLYPAVTPKHESGKPTAFTNEVQAAAEHLLAVVDGKPKEVFGGTYSQVKEILGKIHESGYFDQAQEFEAAEPVEEVIEALPEEVVYDATEQVPEIPVVPVGEAPPVHPIDAEVLPIPTQVPTQQLPPPPEQLYYPPPPQAQMVPPPQQPMRPITEVLGTGSFFFLQDSEIDTPEQIPTQTFTNQTFVAAPPPPIPMPPHFANMPGQLPPPGQLQPHAPPQQQQPAPPQPTANNGYRNDEPASQLPQHAPVMTHASKIEAEREPIIDEPSWDEPKDTMHKPNHNNRPPPRNGGYQQHHNNGNGYNNRPRQNQNNYRESNYQQRNGPRPTNRQH